MNKNKPLIDRFIDFNKLHRIGHRKKECLLAVSGGIDSVVLTDLFAAAGFPFAIAHCNFNLRGEESNADSRFVRNLANQYKVKAYVKVFDTTRYAEEHKISIQVAARRLRYEWFAEICTQKGYGLIITAHHLNDNIETILYNLAKGAGIRGLRGIPVRQGNIARPLLFASRSEIEAYQRDKNLEFREDSSNAEDKYARNKIRHHVIPVLQELNPSFEKTLAEKIGLLTEIEGLYNQRISRLSKQLFVERKGNVYIPLLKIKKTKNVSSVLFEYLKNYGFNSTQVEDMLAAIDEPPGKQFLSDKARIIKDRRFFILTQLPTAESNIATIQATDVSVALNGATFHFSTHNVADVKITAVKNTAFIDASKLTFPLTIRPWKQGDYFYPFGMGMKKKKLKKFFIDEKIPLNEKEQISVIESNGKIVWVAGHRLDERFKVTDKTKQVFRIDLK